jgi:hypothetical protein
MVVGGFLVGFGTRMPVAAHRVMAFLDCLLYSGHHFWLSLLSLLPVFGCPFLLPFIL